MNLQHSLLMAGKSFSGYGHSDVVLGFLALSLASFLVLSFPQISWDYLIRKSSSANKVLVSPGCSPIIRAQCEGVSLQFHFFINTFA